MESTGRTAVEGSTLGSDEVYICEENDIVGKRKTQSLMKLESGSHGLHARCFVAECCSEW